MTNHTMFEPEPPEVWEAWQEWKDGDDSELFDEGYAAGLIKAIEVLDGVRAQENVERVPFHLMMSVVVATLRKLAEGES